MVMQPICSHCYSILSIATHIVAQQETLTNQMITDFDKMLETLYNSPCTFIMNEKLYSIHQNPPSTVHQLHLYG